MEATYIIGGLGVLGSAMARAFEGSVVIDTADPSTLVRYHEMRAGQMAFLCLPTPYDPFAGDYDLSAVRASLECIPPGVIVVLRSTVTPATFSPRVFKQPWVYHPEFLRARCAFEDFIGAGVHVYGVELGTRRHVDAIEKVYRAAGIHAKNVIVLTAAQAAWLKLAHNAWCAMNVAMANEMACYVRRAVGGDWDTLRCALADVLEANGKSWRAFSATPGPDGRRGFGGSCFPKDTAALAGAMARAGGVRDVVEGVLASNAKVRVVE